nr:MAG TPA: hypothetical protein [Caudoviricetes sp.]
MRYAPPYSVSVKSVNSCMRSPCGLINYKWSAFRIPVLM